MSTDREQQRIVELRAPDALVLAGPGCGKTHILAQRVYHALMACGIAPQAMLCLTFTNRAAREMAMRIKAYMGQMPPGLFAGNLHSFCLRFLLANAIIADDTAIVDEDDMAIFLRESFADGLYRNAEIIQRNDLILNMRSHGAPGHLIPRERKEITEEDLDDVEAYRRFKTANGLIDYNDILLLAYLTLSDKKEKVLRMTGYRWIQVDEVQDLSPLQLELIRLLRAEDSEALFLGDEQQSIYGFAGAGVSALQRVKRACGPNIHHLGRNYRSPRQLVEFCNRFACSYLDIDPSLLPQSTRPYSQEDCLQLAEVSPLRAQALCAALARRHLSHPDESTAILTRTNAEAEAMGATLAARCIPHILVGRRDLFRSASFKTVWSHLAALCRPAARSHWARLLYQTHAVPTLAGARQVMARMAEIGVSGDHLLDIDSPTCLESFMELFDNPEATIAVIDTETTGLDVETDDIVQVSAVKIQRGQIVPGSELSLLIESDKEVPEYLGEERNPMFDLCRMAKRTPRREAFQALALYLLGCTVAGHNVEFDRSMLLNNFRRAGQIPPDSLVPEARTIDTLHLARLLYPRLRSHTLGSLIGYLGISGINSHNADDDTAATASLLLAQAREARRRLPQIAGYRAERTMRRVSLRFDGAYGDLYRSSLRTLRDENPEHSITLGSLFKDAHAWLAEREFIKPLPHLDYVVDLIDGHVVNRGNAPSLRQQLALHLHDLLTYNEGDLFAQNIVRERLVVMTIHKAKGMEMDNVILLKAGSSFGDYGESLRVFYVAVSRARRRLTLLFNSDPAAALGPLANAFQVITPGEVNTLLMSDYARGGYSL